jgi:hypothetical protein
MAERHHCLWEVPDGHVAIYLSFSVVDAINAAIEEATATAPVRGAEIGGFLIGKAEQRQQLTVWIDSMEPVPCGYERGPSFRMDGEELESPPGAVGYFRSHTRRDLFLGPDDQALIDLHFSKPENVFLLIKPFKTRPNLGGFFYSKDGKVNLAASPREFPFHRRELGGGEPQIAPAAISRAAPPSPSPAAFDKAEDLPQPLEAEKQRPVMLWAMLAFLGFAASGSIAYLLFERTKPTSAASRPSASTLGLTASEGERDIRLGWDRQSPSIRQATRGTLEIREGSFQKSLDIDADQLRSGSIIYSRPVAITDTVAFRLRLFFEQGPPLSESVQLVSSRPVLPAAALSEPPAVLLDRTKPAPQTAATLVPKTAALPSQVPVNVPKAEAKREPALDPPKSISPPPETPKIPSPQRAAVTKKASPPQIVKPPAQTSPETAASTPSAPPPDATKVASKPDATPSEKKTDAVPVLTRPAPRRIPND